MSDDSSPDPERFGADRRSVLQALGATAAVGVAAGGEAAAAVRDPVAAADDPATAPYELPPLPYDYDALEPHIDARIMELHHDTHHQGYVEGANEALGTLAEMRREGDFEEIKPVKRDLSFNLSGHVLHSVFWENMSPDGGGQPGGELADALDRDFGCFEDFRGEFAAAAEDVEGSGWGMLVYDHLAGRLLVVQVEKHNDVVVQGATPLLVLDVWEHAYYLQYENARDEYVDVFWNVVDWDDVAERYAAATEADLLGRND